MLPRRIAGRTNFARGLHNFIMVIRIGIELRQILTLLIGLAVDYNEFFFVENCMYITKGHLKNGCNGMIWPYETYRD